MNKSAEPPISTCETTMKCQQSCNDVAVKRSGHAAIVCGIGSERKRGICLGIDEEVARCHFSRKRAYSEDPSLAW